MAKTGFSEVKCLVCGNTFEKRNIDIVRYPNHCCSPECRSRRNDKRIEVQCANCEASVKKPPSLLKGKKHIFCSVECANEFQTTKIDVTCPTCGNVFKQHLCIVKRAKHGLNFCSPTCRSKHVFKKSYVEKLFEQMIIPLGIEYDRNNKEVIKPMELDFWFPDLNYAVEINGLSHYKPIYGEEVLAAQKVRDRKKRRLCKEKGIMLRSVRVEKQRDGTFEKRLKRAAWEVKKLMSRHIE